MGEKDVPLEFDLAFADITEFTGPAIEGITNYNKRREWAEVITIQVINKLLTHQGKQVNISFTGKYHNIINTTVHRIRDQNMIKSPPTS